MLIQEEMGVRGVAQLCFFISTLFIIVAANPDSKTSVEHLLVNQISSGEINHDLVLTLFFSWLILHAVWIFFVFEVLSGFFGLLNFYLRE